MTATKKTQKIVFVNRYYDPDQSATSRMLTALARGLAVRGFEVHVATSRQLYDDPGKRLPAEEQLAGVHVHRAATTRFGRHRLVGRALDYASFYAACAVKLLRLLRPGDILVAKTDPPLLSLLAAPIAKAKRCRLVNWQQDVFPEIASRLGANPLPRVLDRWLMHLRDASLRAASTNVLIGARMRDYLAARGIPESKLRVVENWSESVEPKQTAASALRARLELSDRFVVCYSGNLGRAHEFDTFLGAARLLEESSPFVFLMIGDGARMAALKQAVHASGLKNFRFLPYQPSESVADSLAAADVHLASLLPELEGLIVPSKLYGILAAARPLIFIGAPDGDIGRLVQRAGCGGTIAVGDSKGLAELLRRLHAQPQMRAEMGARARTVFCAEFSFERAIERWLRVMEEASS